MIQTKTKRVIATLALAALAIANVANVHATQIGTGSVSGSTSFDSVINWDDTYPGTASGTVSGIVITATVEANLNMVVSTGSIDLGSLAAGIASSGSVDIEVGTNAASGVSITARSGSGGLTNTADNTVQINSLTADGLAESYTYASTAAAIDSTVTGFTSTGNLSAVEITTTAENTIYTTNNAEPTSGLNDVTFTVSATAEAATPAGSYQDTVTFTVIGNF